MSLFSGIGAAKTNKNANYLGEGRYWLQIMKCVIKPDRSGINMFIMETRVIRKDGEGKHSVGEEACHLVKQGDDYFLIDIKSIVLAATGLAEDSMTEQDLINLCDEVVSDAQPLATFVLDYQGTMKETKASTPENPKMFCSKFYKRCVPFSEIHAGLDEEARVKYFGEAFDWETACAAG